jgi:hypothetical protein
MLRQMSMARVSSMLLAAGLSAMSWGFASPAIAQELSRVTTTRKLRIAGIESDRLVPDLLGFTRVQFQGLLATELTSVGYQLADQGDVAASDPHRQPLTLAGSLKEQICDDQRPRQCRIAMQWQLEDARGFIVYRVLTRAVGQDANLETLRRGLLLDALHSLLKRKKFALGLTDFAELEPRRSDTAMLGFKACSKLPTPLPGGVRSVAAALVLVESGSSLGLGSIVSPDGLILSASSSLEPTAPLRVRLAGKQLVPAEIVALDGSADVALLHVDAHFDTTCLPVRDAAPTAGMALFGVSSALAEERAISLSGSVLSKADVRDGKQLLQTDRLIAATDGAPLLDEDGKLVALVSAHASSRLGARIAEAVEVHAAFDALHVKLAAITDPRLAESELGPEAAVRYVRDADDPPFTLARRYTYGTSPAAHTARTASLITLGAGALGVFTTWELFRANAPTTSAGHERAVLLNDLSWITLGLGAVGVGVSYVIPEAHDVVPVRIQNGARPGLFIGLGSGGLTAAGRI